MGYLFLANMANPGENPSPLLPFRLLLYRDITQQVREHLSPGPQLDDRALPSEKAARAVAQQTLARVARVCCALSGPALDVLWKVVDNFVELLYVLPSFDEARKQEEPVYVSTSPHVPY